MLQPLQANEVHLWMLNLLANAQHSVDLWDLLSEEEQGRARCCHIERDRRRFVVRRGMLRQILAQYLGMEPASISLGLGPYGKPEVAGAGEGHILCFSTSHADDLGVVAVTRDHEIGVDVVAHQPRNESFERVASLFAAEEQSWLASMTSESWLRAFFDLWACKEAFVKALGLGLACPLDQFAITFAPPHAPRLLYAPASAGRRPWGLQRFNVGPGFSAALAAEDCLTILRQFECIGDSKRGQPIRLCVAVLIFIHFLSAFAVFAVSHPPSTASRQATAPWHSGRFPDGPVGQPAGSSPSV